MKNKDKALKEIFASDKLNLLQTDESNTKYFFQKLRYKIELIFRYYKF